jgi:hypothetical protein
MQRIFFTGYFIMNLIYEKQQKLIVFFIFLISFAGNVYPSPAVISWKSGDKNIVITLKNRIEGFFGRGLQTLNRVRDDVLYIQDTWDFKIDTKLGTMVSTKMALRNKSRWGEPTSIAKTTETLTPIVESLGKPHKHSLAKQFFWMREGWLNLHVNEAFGLRLSGDHYFKAGFFPFSLGLGISLGDAYAVSPGFLGFNPEGGVDQYAPGFLWHGDLVKNKATYDCYCALLSNKSGNFDDVNENIYFNRVGFSDSAARGFGHLNIIFATRLQWEAIKSEKFGKLTLEPYVMINSDPEQMVDFFADAESTLGTVGLFCDYNGSNFECGVEFAGNFGHQRVLPWDRNLVRQENREGYMVFAYDKVLETTNKDKGALQTTANKKAVQSGPKGPEQNGKIIKGTTLKNSENRFRAGYNNKYGGYMMVADCGLWLRKDKLKMLATVGFASGDEDPNRDLEDLRASEQDDTFNGFIGLQEVYCGRRVPSVVYLVGSYRIPRPLSAPSRNLRDVATSISGFSNIVLAGIGFDYTVENWCKESRWNIKPNLLGYWQERSTKKFDINTGMSSDEHADRFLGTELNILVDVNLHESLRGFLTTGVFIPGGHYRDIRGKPIKSDMLKIFENLSTQNMDANNPGCACDLPKFNINKVQVINDLPAYIVNLGIEYTF